MLPTDIMVTWKEIWLAIMYKSIAFLNEQLVQSAAVNWDSIKKKKKMKLELSLCHLQKCPTHLTYVSNIQWSWNLVIFWFHFTSVKFNILFLIVQSPWFLLE